MQHERFLIFILGFSVWAEEFVICRGSPPRTIKCEGPDEMIDVQDALIVLDEDTNYCTDPNVNITDKMQRRVGIAFIEELPFTKYLTLKYLPA